MHTNRGMIDAMAECCYAGEYGEFFSEREADRTARRFERRGLRGSARVLADGVVEAGVDGGSVLEVGGGVGDLQIELLRRGAAEAVNVELSPSWEPAAGRLLERSGLGGRVQRRVGDFVALGEELPRADVVVLHRVLCCYPHWPAMLDAALGRSRRLVAVTVPVDRPWTKVVVAAGNALLRLRGRQFRAFVHPTHRVIATMQAGGFRIRSDHAGLVWRTIVAQR
jgi:hypothetical protein